ncbi:MAG: hypothetical protein P6D49_06965 [Acidimicrobiales bacterium]|nr:hypothetical protein [Acidimicrobiales bacterium]
MPWTGAPVLVGFNAGLTATELTPWSGEAILVAAPLTLDTIFA